MDKHIVAFLDVLGWSAVNTAMEREEREISRVEALFRDLLHVKDLWGGNTDRMTIMSELTCVFIGGRKT